jgi:hypothetical protein
MTETARSLLRRRDRHRLLLLARAQLCRGHGFLDRRHGRVDTAHPQGCARTPGVSAAQPRVSAARRG